MTVHSEIQDVLGRHLRRVEVCHSPQYGCLEGFRQRTCGERVGRIIANLGVYPADLDLPAGAWISDSNPGWEEFWMGFWRGYNQTMALISDPTSDVRALGQEH